MRNTLPDCEIESRTNSAANTHWQTGLLMLLLITLAHTGFSQVYVNGINMNELPVTYCRIDFGSGPLFTSRTYVQVSYGQEEKGLSRYLITDQHGERILFNSELDAMNYMSRNGWKLVDSILKLNDSNSKTEYIFERSRELIVRGASSSMPRNTYDCQLLMDVMMEPSSGQE